MFRIFKEQGESLGLSGSSLVEFIQDQQRQDREAKEREAERIAREKEREAERIVREKEIEAERIAREKEIEAERIAREKEIEERDKDRQVELEKIRLQAEKEIESARAQNEFALEAKRIESRTAIETAPHGGVQGPSKDKVKLPYLDDKDDIEAYLIQFERVATINGWKESEWGARLAPLLRGKARDTYIKLPVEEAVNYDCIKRDLLHRFKLNAWTYRQKFRAARPEKDEEDHVFWDRLDTYLDRWITLSDREREELFTMLLLEKFIETQSVEKARFIREREPKTKDDAVRAAKLFEEIRGTERRSRDTNPSSNNHTGFKSFKRDFPRLSSNNQTNSRFNQGRQYPQTQHNEDRQNQKDPDRFQKKNFSGPPTFHRKFMTGCYECGGNHHSRNCPKKTNDKVAVATTVIAAAKLESKTTLCENCKEIPFNPKCIVNIEGKTVDALRDTGATKIVVSKELVPKNCYTGETKEITMASESAKEQLPIAVVELDTPYFNGKTEVMVMEKPVVPVLIGNTRTKEGTITDIPVYPTKEVVANHQTETNRKKGLKLKPLRMKETELSKITPKELKEQQIKDDTLKTVMKRAKKKAPFICRSNGVRTQYYFKKEILYRKVQQGDRVTNQVIVPKPYRNEILRVAHDIPTAGHQGVQKTKDRILSAFYWPGIDSEVRRYCLSCDPCQRCVHKGNMRKAPLQRVPVISTPFKRVAVDIIGPITPASNQGNRYVLTMIDYATKYAEAVAMKEIDSEHISEALWQMWTRLGIPEEIISDRGSQFISKIMQDINKLLNIKGITTTPYHAQTNGLVEKFNGTIKLMIKKLSIEQPKEWDKYIPALLFAYRETPQCSTQFSPFELLYGRTVRGPLHVLKKCWTEEEIDDEVRTTAEYVTNLRNRIEDTCKIAEENMKKAKDKYKDHYDKKTKARTLETGSKVLLLLPERNKLQLAWKGPYTVIKKVNYVDYIVDVNGKHRMYHINLLKEYFEREKSEAVAVVMHEDEGTESYNSKIETIPLKRSEDHKQTLTSKPVMQLPDKNRQYILRTDASDRGVGAVLLQEYDDILKPVAYASKKLTGSEKNYSTIEKECLAIVWGTKKFEPYLYGTHFILETDHKPLQYLSKTKTVNGRLMRWALHLQQYSFTLRVIPGEENLGADYLSRLDSS